jgi:hypothetical protein
MTDISIYVTLITAALSGAAIPAITVQIRDVRRAERDRRERKAEAKRQACLDLLGAAGELGTRVANTAQYIGVELGVRQAEIRESEAAVQLRSAAVALFYPGALTEPAERLVAAASSLAAAAVAPDNTNTLAGEIIRKPDFSVFDKSVADFRRAAVDDAGA